MKQAFECVAWQRDEASKTEAAVLLLMCNGANLTSEEMQKAIAIDVAAQESALRAIDAFQEKHVLRVRSASCGSTTPMCCTT